MSNKKRKYQILPFLTVFPLSYFTRISALGLIRRITPTVVCLNPECGKSETQEEYITERKYHGESDVQDVQDVQIATKATCFFGDEEETDDYEPEESSEIEQVEEADRKQNETISVHSGGVASSEPDFSVAIETEQAEPPQFLREKKIWVCWRYEQVEGKDKPTKVPYIAQISRAEVKAKSNDVSTWRNYDDAKKLYERSVSEGWKRPFSGIGIMCDGSFTVLDYDHCLVDGAISEQVLYRIQAIDSYAELSPSATGVHQIALGAIPNAVKKSDIEMYCTGRFLTWTHNQIVGLRSTIQERQEQLSELHTEVAQPAPMPLRRTARANTPQCGFSLCSDDEIIAKAKAARNGAKFADLWGGTWSSYSSQSEADMALCSLLAYWTNYNEVAMERLFKQSGLYREDKWSRSVGRGETYGQRTISRACNERRSA